MHLTMVSTSLLKISSLLVCLAVAGPLAAADPAFVGVLAYALEDDAAAKLEIDAETQAELKKLIAQREDQALELALSIRDLSKAEQTAKLAPFVAESEKLGFALLSAAQQAGLKKYDVKKKGLKTLLSSEMAETLKLSERQQQEIAQLASKIDAAQAAGAPAVEAAQKEFEREARKRLSPSQQAGWDRLAGLVGAPGDPLPEITPPTEQQPAEKPAAEMKPQVATGEPAGDAKPSDSASDQPKLGPDGEPRLRFSFRYAPWRDVLDWFADQADLSMVMDAPPAGTFNYTDGRDYTPSEAIDLLNSVLLTKGYTLVRREKMLLVINLEDGIPPNLVTTVPVEKLDGRGEYELVSTLFTLSRMTAEEADAEISKLIGPQGQVVVLPKSKQIFVTETAGRLRTIRDVINSVERPLSEQVQIVDLKNVGPEEALTVVRQLLDLPPEANGSEDGSLRIAVDALGGRLFVSGEPELTSRVQEILKMVDQPGGVVDVGEQPQLEVYAVGASQPETVLQVMQTLLAGLPEVRLAIDENTGNLVALAKPSQHATIRATLDQMQRDAKKISVFQLQTVDPQLAVLSISKLFGGGGETPNPSAPIVDADPLSGMLLVRGTQDQVDQINDLLKQMGEDPEAALASSLDRGKVRTLSLPSSASAQILDELEMIWPTVSTARIRVVRPSSPPIRTVAPEETPGGDEFQQNLRLLFPPNETPSPLREDESAAAPRTSPFRFVSETTAAPEPAEANADQPASTETAKTDLPVQPKKPAEIIIMPGPGGLVIASEDTEALDRLEELVQMLGDRIANSGADYTVFYLKHAPAAVAADLLSRIMTGQAASGGGDEGGGLLGDMASNMLGGGGGLMGSLLGLGGGGGGSYAASGSFSVVADGRLNALVVKGSPTDVQVIEQLLEIIDQPHSPEDVQTKAKPRMIPVLYQPANDVLNVVKQVYADRIAESGGGQQRQPSPEDFIRALRGGRGGRGGGGGGGEAQSEPPKMTIGVDARSNALIVSAPDPLFEEVKLLVEQIDQAGSDSQETMQVVNIRKSNPATVQNALQSILGANMTTNTSSPTSNGQSSSNQQPDQAAADAMRQRMEMFNRIRGAMERGGRGGDRGQRGGERGGRGGERGGRGGR
ncbi:MAG: secretin N-terminal domain-containing protein [Blastopirellula sp. JB062]